MRALVVYESTFGNTEAVARAVAQGLSAALEVEVVEVRRAPVALPEDVALVVVGGPTHVFGMSRPRTRQDGARQAGREPGDEPGIREWLAGLTRPRADVAAAAFDTRVARPRLPGSAARAARRRLRRRGLRPAVGPASFWVEGTPGPLVAGELERARRWGQELASQVGSAAAAVR